MTETPPPRHNRLVRFAKLLLKIAVTIACLWYVSTKIDFEEVRNVLSNANHTWLITGFFVYTLSKWIGAKRLNIYFENIGARLPSIQNLKLYWLGMFYNLFLPGAITGDAYKVIRLSKMHGTGYKKLTAAVLLDRISGLLSLFIIVAVYSFFTELDSRIKVAFLVAAVLCIPIAWWITRRFFSEFLPGFRPTFFLGALVQLLVLACVYCILFALGIDDDRGSYIFIFLIAAIVSVLPISVGGGLGVREFTIMQAATFFSLEQHTALLISLLFYIITVICSAAGVYFVFRDPLSSNKSKVISSK